MKKIQFFNLTIAFSLLITFLAFISCNQEHHMEHNDNLLKSTVLIDRNVFGVKSFNKQVNQTENNNSDLNIEVAFTNGAIKTYYYNRTETYLKLYETTGEKRELLISNNENGVIFKKNGIITTIENTLFDDMFVAAYIMIGGNINAIDAPPPFENAFENECIHSAISIQGRKSVSEGNVQTMVNNFLKDHKECKQIGAVDSYCVFGDFACFSVSEISCPSGSSTCN
jgi:hypothetical protein